MRRPLLIARPENVSWWRITQSWSVATWLRAVTVKNPVLLSVEGHFTLEANPDTGAPTKVLAPDTAGKFYPNQDCSSLGQ